MIICGISTGFPVLFPTSGQITHVLLTRAPLYSEDCSPFLARLACVRHAASVDSEPGSNSQDFLMRLILRWVSPTRFALKTELTRKILLLYVFCFQRTLRLSGLKLGVKKTASICSAEFSTNHTQQLICRLGHLSTIGIVSVTVKRRFRFFLARLSHDGA